MKRFCVVALCVVALASPAWGALAAAGPIDPANGFPQFFQDSTGMALQIGLDPVQTFFDPAIVGNAFSEQIGFGGEAFYFLAEANISYAGGTGAALCVLAVEAAFATGDPVDGEQIAFGRIRLRIDAPVAGRYRVTHPYGQQNFDVATPGRRAINNTVDIIGAAPDFSPALATAVGPFLTAVAPAAPAGFIGSFGALQTVTGSPAGNNLFRIDGPNGSNLAGAGNNRIETNQFNLSGQIFVPAVPPPPGTAILPTPLIVDRAEMISSRNTMTINILVTSSNGATVTLKLSAAGAPVTLTPDNAGRFFGRFRVPTSQVDLAAVSVTAEQVGLTTPTTLPLTLTDTVTIRSATYSSRTQTLTITASSSDTRRPAPTLSAVGDPLHAENFGDLRNGRLIVRNLAIPPTTITVNSSVGGSATANVVIR